MPSESERGWINLVRATEMLLTDKISPRFRAEAIFLPSLSRGMAASGNIFFLTKVWSQRSSSAPVIFNGSDGRGMPPQDKPKAAWPGRY